MESATNLCIVYRRDLLVEANWIEGVSVRDAAGIYLGVATTHAAAFRGRVVRCNYIADAVKGRARLNITLAHLQSGPVLCNTIVTILSSFLLSYTYITILLYAALCSANNNSIRSYRLLVGTILWYAAYYICGTILRE